MFLFGSETSETQNSVRYIFSFSFKILCIALSHMKQAYITKAACPSSRIIFGFFMLVAQP